jgi:hypothetical protein
MSVPIRPDLDDADLWESYVDQGLSPEEATEHVKRRRQRNTEQRLDFGGQEKREAQPDFSGLGGAIGAAALKAGQGASFGLSDDIAGLMGGDTEGARLALEGAQQQRPVLSTVSDIAGSAISPTIGAKTAARLVGKAPLVFRGVAGAGAGAVTGGLTGAAHGAGRGNTPEERESLAKVGAGSGAILGLIMGGLAGRTSAKFQRTAESDRLRQMRLAEAERGMPETAPLDPGATPEALASKRLGLSPEQLRGNRSPEGQAIVDRMKGKAPKITDDPIAQRIAGSRSAPTPGSTTQQAAPPMQAPAAGKGKTLPYYPRGGAAEQKVGPLPSVSPRQGPQMSPEAIRTSVELARTLGQSDEQIAALLARQGISADEVRAILGGP